ncbi:hypothetical protein QQF64_011405 [Cirrhinus molitorella]|uniref:Integrase catalytic domain-containing protein n=1 Tax=Cirrhinus molitorella TaxID=172907 RepID=A0ABR3M1M6_9TELE
MTSNSKSDPPVVRPRRQIRPPAHLADYQIPGSGYVKKALPTACLDEVRIEDAPLTPEYVSRSSSPKSQQSYTGDLLLQDEWRESDSAESELHLQAKQLSDIKSMWTEMKRDSDELRSHILPEILSALRGLKAENDTLKQEIQQISTGIETPHRSVTPVPAPRSKVPQPTRSQYPSVTQGEQLTRQMRDFTLLPRLEQKDDGESHCATPRRAAEAVHYYEDNPPFRHGHYPDEREFHLPQRSVTSPRAEMDDTVKTVTYTPDSSTKRRDGRYDKSTAKSTSILMGTEKPFIDSETRVSASKPRPSSNRSRGKPEQYDSLPDYVDACGQELHGAAYTSCADTQREVQHKILCQAQAESFPMECSLLKSGKPVAGTSRLASLSPELDSATGLIRVGGHLRHCNVLEVDAVHPIVLDPQNPVTRLIIRDYDERLRHPGSERLFAEIRRTYWILRGREAIRRYQRQCVECRKWRGRPEVPLMADLPLTRQRYFKPAFYSTGMDCFGPFVIKIGCRKEKRWGIVFKCMTIRAVYLDILHSIDSDSFLMALRRFITRRGKPYELLCDQGTNFKGGDRELSESFEAMQDELQSHLASQQIKFVYNPPSAPHFGGCWEREIRSIKAALKVTIGAQTVTEEVLRTVLVEVEGILNSKPLGYTSSDVADLDPITPFCFLIGRRDASLPQVVYQNSEILSRRRWRHGQLLADHFWRHFLKYYLPSLQARQKWKTEKRALEIGDVVMIVDPQLPRSLWPVGKVTQIFPGIDGRVRTANVDVKDERIQSLNSGAAVQKAWKILNVPDNPTNQSVRSMLPPHPHHERKKKKKGSDCITRHQKDSGQML